MGTMTWFRGKIVLGVCVLAGIAAAADAPAKKEGPLRVTPRPIAQDPTVKYDFDIVCVRSSRKRLELLLRLEKSSFLRHDHGVAPWGSGQRVTPLPAPLPDIPEVSDDPSVLLPLL